MNAEELKQEFFDKWKPYALEFIDEFKIDIDSLLEQYAQQIRGEAYNMGFKDGVASFNKRLEKRIVRDLDELLEQYAQQIAVEFMYWYEYPTMDKINCEDEFKEWTNHQNQSNE